MCYMPVLYVNNYQILRILTVASFTAFKRFFDSDQLPTFVSNRERQRSLNTWSEVHCIRAITDT